ncbi:hypothetical protein SARC_03396 [Sphaeroforma arctica JP610]|uniref:SAP domain-containing protein n=1 Tax=Sphaeroforma arctica JP610 TaxID=667725 RepID=A0A0L0G603_9EUKA|nr:hypothetical protein SARC_03396 [Sphaeroforma arctica JP610]KNC84379.1 hypothetical protein SARC_03396 [Sphaeroforma arctica JP610]|eukprot:XP_014158281.1 hypothetical protein SARC_03396 [Sphaeroforma arctica JP610]
MAMPEKAPRDYNSVNGLLNSMTKTELTIILDFLRERKSGNKPLLVDRIKQWLHNEKCTSGENGENWIRVTELMYNTLAPRRGKAQVPLTYNDGASSISRRSTSAGPQRQSHSHNAAIRATLPYGRPGSIGYNTYGNNNIQPPHTYPNNPQANSHSQLNPQLYPASGATTGTTASQGLQTKFTVNPFFRPLRELCPPTRLSGSGSSANITLMFRLSSVERASFMELDYRVIIRSCTEQAPPGVGSGEPRKGYFDADVARIFVIAGCYVGLCLVGKSKWALYVYVYG